MLLSLLSRRTLEADSRDSYGFAVRPQHLQRYKEYGNIYKEEEEERSKKWWNFLEQFTKPSLPCTPVAKNSEAQEENDLSGTDEVIRHKPDGYDSDGRKLAASDSGTKWRHEQALHLSKESKHQPIRSWGPVRPALEPIEKMMSVRAMNLAYEHVRPVQKYLPSIDEENLEVNISLNNIENWFPQSELALVERDEAHEVSKDFVDSKFNGMTESSEITSQDEDKEFTDINKNEEINIDSLANAEPSLPRKEELESLVHGGVPKSLRGEVWQAFVGAQTRRVESYYHKLLSSETDSGDRKNVAGVVADNSTTCAPEIWKKQIEKDLPRTFPGHPALDEEGRNSLRRILTAYALHNPCVGYCQAMNFFAGLLLLLMPEENAFWTLVGIIDDYFNGCYTQEMIESQVDQLVFEELMRERFPKLVNHLDYLGVEVAWISGPWFLSIFVNMLPWESVLRIWDVLLFEGNRVMLFRTALALMELYGPALLTTKDAGDAVTLLQSLTGSTFDSSQLVLTACMGFHSVTESRLDELRKKHRHSVLEIIEERTNGSPISKNSKSLASKLYSFKHDAQSLIKEPNTNQGFNEKIDSLGSKVNSSPDNFDEFMCGLSIDSKIDALPDLQEQVVWLKVELCRLMEEKRLATLRTEELETAFLEMVKQDNRRELSARVEQLEQEVALLQQALSDKQEQERVMLEVLMRIEQEQKITEDARIAAGLEVAAQKSVVCVLQEKYEKAMTSVAEMEKRVLMAESMLEATLQYESGQAKAQNSPRSTRPPDSPHTGKKIGILSFGLGRRDKNKERSCNEVAPMESKLIGKKNKEDKRQIYGEES